ncbi:MAG TPA: hypothetical protein VGB89_07860 [Bacteroidota bacterium]
MNIVPDNKELTIRDGVLRTLLYYDIWHYPLSSAELYMFLPVNTISLDEFRRCLGKVTDGNIIRQYNDYYFVRGIDKPVVQQRSRKEKHARHLWRMARFFMHIIKRFPYVRAVFVSGDLSKNATTRNSDVDFFLLTEPGKLWITRTLLIAFKKIFLFNKKKYFCLNYLATTDHLRTEEENIFVATEIAHLKPLYNLPLFQAYLDANTWIKNYFPNFDLRMMSHSKVSNKKSALQKMFETILNRLPTESIDRYLQAKMEQIWQSRYPEFEESVRKKIFRSTRDESRAYVGNFEEKILALYSQKLQDFGLKP